MTGLSRSVLVWVGVPWVIAVMVGAAASQQAGDRPLVTQAEYDRWLTGLSNWGRWARQDAIGPFDTGAEAAGLDNAVIPWLKARDVALIGWETPGYMPQPPRDLPRLALHDFALTMLGVHLLDRADFDALAEAAAVRNRWEFMLTIGLLPIPNGTGSPVNPIAIF